MDSRNQFAAVCRIADSRRRKRLQPVHAVIQGKARKTHNGGDGAIHRLFRQRARFAKAGAETTKYPLIEKRVRVSVSDIENYQPNGIRSDIDDSKGFVLVRELRRNASVSIGCWHRGKCACGPIFSLRSSYALF